MCAFTWLEGDESLQTGRVVVRTSSKLDVLGACLGDSRSSLVRIAVPNKGRLREPALRVLKDAGIEPLYGDSESRALVVPTTRDDVRLVFMRTEDIPGIVASGAADLGITGHDYVVEYGAEIFEDVDLGFGAARLVLAVPRGLGIDDPSQLPPGIRIATKYVNIARRYAEEKGLEVKILRISGASEAMPSLGAADAVIDVVSTGTSMRLHGLKPIDTVLETTARLIRSPSTPLKGLVEEIVETIRSVVRARTLRLVLMNVPGEALERVLRGLPAMSAPAVSRLESGEPMWEVITAVPLDLLPRTIVEAKRRGARDIIVLGVEKVIP